MASATLSPPSSCLTASTHLLSWLAGINTITITLSPPFSAPPPPPLGTTGLLLCPPWQPAKAAKGGSTQSH